MLATSAGIPSWIVLVSFFHFGCFLFSSVWHLKRRIRTPSFQKSRGVNSVGGCLAENFRKRKAARATFEASTLPSTAAPELNCKKLRNQQQDPGNQYIKQGSIPQDSISKRRPARLMRHNCWSTRLDLLTCLPAIEYVRPRNLDAHFERLRLHVILAFLLVELTLFLVVFSSSLQEAQIRSRNDEKYEWILDGF